MQTLTFVCIGQNFLSLPLNHYMIFAGFKQALSEIQIFFSKSTHSHQPGFQSFSKKPHYLIYNVFTAFARPPLLIYSGFHRLFTATISAPSPTALQFSIHMFLHGFSMFLTGPLFSFSWFIHVSNRSPFSFTWFLQGYEHNICRLFIAHILHGLVQQFTFLFWNGGYCKSA